MYTTTKSAMSAYRLTTRWNAVSRVMNGGQEQLPKLRMRGLFPRTQSRIGTRRRSWSSITSVLGAARPRCADLRKSNFWPYHTARRDSKVNIRLESETHTGGSSGSSCRSPIFDSTFFRREERDKRNAAPPSGGGDADADDNRWSIVPLAADETLCSYASSNGEFQNTMLFPRTRRNA
ncbi:hypothetical protein EYF80_045907 [Liparis tanakae]|uniref:Uncharacterized protein n=1 Tax=Liparis tanakae TaxID=230148 RepID=A0A4Z2FSK9_9TELE|nr:hypothetical protein EYF80_045907 [Liparis tanakae]